MKPVIALFALLALSANIFAQTSFGRISGAVTDPGGAAIAQDDGRDLQDVILHLGKSVPAFASRILETLGS